MQEVRRTSHDRFKTMAQFLTQFLKTNTELLKHLGN